MTARKAVARKAAATTTEKAPEREPSKADIARQAEADGYVTIEHCGLQLRIPIKGKVPVAAYLAFKNGDEFGGTEALLGPDQWAAFLATNPTIDDLNEIGAKLTELVGN